MNHERKLIGFLIILLIVCCLLSGKAQAKNEYLGNNGCERENVHDE
ncbi:hypothetical protein [uncultured Winogradskyella sp.]